MSGRIDAVLFSSMLTACGFSITPGVALDAPTEDTGTGDSTVELDAAIDSGTNNPCAAPDPTGLVACYQFEDTLTGGAGVLTDRSGNGHDATASGFTLITRPVNTMSQALTVGGSASALVPQHAAFDLTGPFTLSAWIRPVNPGTTTNKGLIDHDGQWAMSIRNGLLACWFQRQPNLALISTPMFANTEWQFVACTWDGNLGCVVRITASGLRHKSCELVPNAAAVGSNGISLGSFQNGSGVPEERFSGSMDDIRIYARTLTDQELCVLAERTTCP